MLATRTHHCDTPFEGDPRDAFDVARTALLSQGFEILEDSASELCARGPGMHSTQQPALLGASELRFRVASSMLSATATLGGVASMKRFVILFPPALVLSLTATLAVTQAGGSWWALLAAAPWLLLAPWISSLLEHRTTRAVDRLVRGMAGARTRR